MTPEDVQTLQEKILRLCHAAGRLGLPEDRMRHALEDTGYLKRELIREGYGVDNETLERQLRYLASKGWIEEVRKELRPDLRRWQTTAAGDEFLMKQGFI